MVLAAHGLWLGPEAFPGVGAGTRGHREAVPHASFSPPAVPSFLSACQGNPNTHQVVQRTVQRQGQRNMVWLQGLSLQVQTQLHGYSMLPWGLLG